MMPNTILVAFVVLGAQALAQKAVWDKEPDSFRGAKFLAAESEVRSKFTMADCLNRENEEKTCLFLFNIASAEIAGVATFHRDALVDVSGVFLQDDFATVLDAFLDRYGNAPSRIADQLRWNGKAVNMELERVVADDRKPNLKAIVSSFCATQTSLVAKEDSHAQSLSKQQDEDMQRSGADISERAQEAIRSLRRRQEEHEKNITYADAQCQNFSGRAYGLFSITDSPYAIELEKRRLEERKKGASAL